MSRSSSFHAGPYRPGNDLGEVRAVGVPGGDVAAFLEQAPGQGGRLQAEREELVVAHDRLVLISLSARVEAVPTNGAGRSALVLQLASAKHCASRWQWRQPRGRPLVVAGRGRGAGSATRIRTRPMRAGG